MEDNLNGDPEQQPTAIEKLDSLIVMRFPGGPHSNNVVTEFANVDINQMIVANFHLTRSIENQLRHLEQLEALKAPQLFRPSGSPIPKG